MRLKFSPQKFAGLHDEIQFRVLQRFHRTPEVTQRKLARDLGVSLGSINFCCQALVEKGFVKMQNFSRSQNKLGYVYLLTPSGFNEKSRLAAKFLRRKLAEYEAIQAEINALRSEVDLL
jgi:EPS-associated MarR family transcriptional regulator